MEFLMSLYVDASSILPLFCVTQRTALNPFLYLHASSQTCSLLCVAPQLAAQRMEEARAQHDEAQAAEAARHRAAWENELADKARLAITLEDKAAFQVRFSYSATLSIHISALVHIWLLKGGRRCATLEDKAEFQVHTGITGNTQIHGHALGLG